MRGNVHGIEAPDCWNTGVVDWMVHCKASDVTWELSFQLLSGGQTIELFEDEKASPEGFVGEMTVLQVHRCELT